MARKQSLTSKMIERGFDRTRAIPFERGVKIGCSQCEALAINGVPTHETGCPNQKGKCDECGSIIPKSQRYCDEHCAGTCPGCEDCNPEVSE